MEKNPFLARKRVHGGGDDGEDGFTAVPIGSDEDRAAKEFATTPCLRVFFLIKATLLRWIRWFKPSRSRASLAKMCALLLLITMLIALLPMNTITSNNVNGYARQQTTVPKPVDDEEADLYADPQDFERYHADGSDQPIPLPVVDVPGSPHRVTEENGSPVKYRFPFTRAQCSRNLEGREQDLVREMLRHSWRAYKRYGWGTDELLPLSRKGRNLYGASGIGYTIIDTLDTFLITGLNEEAEEAIEWIEKKLSFNSQVSVSVFEATIRILGGLLSAYELTGRESLKAKAVDIGDRLARAFSSRSDGLPVNGLHLLDGPPQSFRALYLAEVGSLQLEFFTLSKITGNWTYDTLARRVYDVVRPVCTGGLCPQILPNPVRHGHIGHFGGMSDSYYEYLPKYYLLTGRRPRDEPLLAQWRDIMNTFVKQTTFSCELQQAAPIQASFSDNTHPLYIAAFDRSAGRLMEHLACFSGGLFALSAMFLDQDVTNRSGHQLVAVSNVCGVPSAEAGEGQDRASPSLMHTRPRSWGSLVERNTYIGEELGKTCHAMYDTTPSGLSAESATVNVDGTIRSHEDYRQRPETVESYFYLWRATKKKKYREWGREMLQAWCLQLGHPNGFVGLSSVTRPRRPRRLSEQQVRQNRELRLRGGRHTTYNPPVGSVGDDRTARDVMETFWLAESLKYMFLLFSDDDVMDLREWVFNTEAHPFRIVKATS